MHNYAQGDEHGLIFSVFQSSVPIDDPIDLIEIADFDEDLIGRYLIGNGEISAPPEPGSFYVWNDAISSFEQVVSNS